jgi:excisionase family DNA binding protein
MSSVAETPALKLLVSTAEIAGLFGVSPNTVLEWAKAGSIAKPIRMGRRTIRWHRADVLAMLAGNRPTQGVESPCV